MSVIAIKRSLSLKTNSLHCDEQLQPRFASGAQHAGAQYHRNGTESGMDERYT